MNLHPSPNPLRAFLEGDGGENEVDLSKVTPEEFFRNDLTRYRISGAIPPGVDFSTVNFVACTLHDVTAEGVDFSECDFKDTFLKGGTFTDCSFNGGTFATTFFADTEFRRCTFYNLAAHSSDFRSVRFIDCDLTNLLVKSSRFSECMFQGCTTSNKICELSTLFGVVFDGTPIQVETITGNFGLTSDGLVNAQVRSGRVREAHDFLGAAELEALLKSRKLSSLERLSLEYFLNHTLLGGSAALDESLDLTQWVRIYRNPGSFVELLDKFAEFLVHAYDENRLPVHAILLLHHVTSTLTYSVPQGEGLHRVAMSLGGIHLILSRVVEDYLYVLDLTSNQTSGRLVFRAEGPADPDYFKAQLEPWIGGEEVVISRLERNSPLVVEFTASNVAALLSLLAAFLATRTKLEITRLRADVASAGGGKPVKRLGKKGASKRNLPAKVKAPQHPVLSVSSGRVDKPNPAYEFRVRALMPGSLLVDLRLNFSTTLVQRIRGVLLTLLAGPPAKGG